MAKLLFRLGHAHAKPINKYQVEGFSHSDIPMQYAPDTVGVIWWRNLISETGQSPHGTNLIIQPLTVSGLLGDCVRPLKFSVDHPTTDGIRSCLATTPFRPTSKPHQKPPQNHKFSVDHPTTDGIMCCLATTHTDPLRNHPKNQHKTTYKTTRLIKNTIKLKDLSLGTIKNNQIEGFETWDPSHEKERAKICRMSKSRASGTACASSYSQIIVLKPRNSIFSQCASFRLSSYLSLSLYLSPPLPNLIPSGV